MKMFLKLLKQDWKLKVEPQDIIESLAIILNYLK